MKNNGVRLGSVYFKENKWTASGLLFGIRFHSKPKRCEVQRHLPVRQPDQRLAWAVIMHEGARYERSGIVVS